MVTILIFYRRRASPKHRYNIIEEDYGGGGHRTRLRNDHDDQLVCQGVPPAPVYKGARGERVAGLGGGRAKGGVLFPPGVGLLLSLLEKERGGEGQGKGGCPPCPIRTRGGAQASFLLASLLYSRMAQ